MAHFLKPAAHSGTGYEADNKLAPGSVWRMQVPVGTAREIALWGGAGLFVRSNNPTIVPNTFTERASHTLRIINVRGLALGTSMVEVGSGNQTWVSLQVQVVGHAGAGGANAISQAGVNFIAREERFVGRLYNDAAFHATIGYGHLVHYGRVGTNAAAEAPYVNGITQAQATQLLHQDLATYVNAVNRAVRVPLTQTQFDALVSFAYNIGVGGMQGSQVVRLVNAGGCTPVQIQQAFGLWVHGNGVLIPGLVNRRNHETNLFNNGVY